MKISTKRALAIICYIFGIASAAWGLGYTMGFDDGFKEDA